MNEDTPESPEVPPLTAQPNEAAAIANRKAVFLKSYGKWGNIAEGCRVAGVDRRTFYRWRDGDPDFKALLVEMREQAVEGLEREAWKRAQDGRHEPVFYKGRIVGTVKKPSDLLTIFLLKGERPDKYRERFEHTGANGTPLIPVTGIQISLVSAKKAGE